MLSESLRRDMWVGSIILIQSLPSISKFITSVVGLVSEIKTTPLLGGIVYFDVSISRVLYPSHSFWNFVLDGSYLSSPSITLGVERLSRFGRDTDLYQVSVFLTMLLPAPTVGFYPTLFTRASSAFLSFKLKATTIGGIVSVAPPAQLYFYNDAGVPILHRDISLRRWAGGRLLTATFYQ